MWYINFILSSYKCIMDLIYPLPYTLGLLYPGTFLVALLCVFLSLCLATFSSFLLTLLTRTIRGQVSPKRLNCTPNFMASNTIKSQIKICFNTPVRYWFMFPFYTWRQALTIICRYFHLSVLQEGKLWLPEIIQRRLVGSYRSTGTSPEDGTYKPSRNISN
jgi:hypothetical protein